MQNFVVIRSKVSPPQIRDFAPSFWGSAYYEKNPSKDIPAKDVPFRGPDDP